MFPLGTVVFPYGGIPLRIFEPRYHALLDHVLDEDSTFGSVLIRRGHEVGGGDVRFDVGTRLRVLAHQRLADGNRAVVVAGIERIRVLGWLDDDPHPWAEVSSLPEEPGAVDDLVEQACSRLERLLAMASEMGADTADVDLDMGEDPLVASYRVAALLPVTPLDAYSLLTAEGARARLLRSVELLDDQIELIRLRMCGS